MAALPVVFWFKVGKSPATAIEGTPVPVVFFKIPDDKPANDMPLILPTTVANGVPVTSPYTEALVRSVVKARIPEASGREMALFDVVGVQFNVPVTPPLCNTNWFDVPDKFSDGIVKAAPTVFPIAGTPVAPVTKMPLLVVVNPEIVLAAEANISWLAVAALGSIRVLHTGGALVPPLRK